MARQKIRFIINPISGTKKKSLLPQTISKHLDMDLFDYEIMFSEFAGHAKQLSQEAVVQRCHIVVAIGGDGTINEVGSPLIGTDVALGILPFGSGNGLSHHLGLPMRPEKAIDIINRNHREKIDTITVNGLPCISIAGTGFDAQVADDYGKDPRRGFDTYLKYIIRNYLYYKEQDYEIITPETSLQTRAFFIAVANSNEQGYNIPIAPHADLQDGKVDVCILMKPNLFELPIVGGMMINKRIDKAPKVVTLQASELKIIRECNAVVNIDGEPVNMEKDLDIKVNPLSLNIITDENQKQPRRHCLFHKS